MGSAVSAGSDFGGYASMPAPLDESARVLVVEDDPVQALVLTLHLERLGIAATQVSDGAHALDTVQSQEFAMVLMDVVMPLTDGIEATREIRAWERAQGRPRVPIVAVTASAMPDECRSYIEAGMDEILVKPFTARDLHDVVLRHLVAQGRGRALPAS